jgi:hypothetical protein
MMTTRSTAKIIKLEHGPVTAFVARKAEIDAMLARLQTLSESHFGLDPEDVTWSEVGTLERYASLLKQLTDQAFHEGEHAG